MRRTYYGPQTSGEAIEFQSTPHSMNEANAAADADAAAADAVSIHASLNE